MSPLNLEKSAILTSVTARVTASLVNDVISTLSLISGFTSAETMEDALIYYVLY